MFLWTGIGGWKMLTQKVEEGLSGEDGGGVKERRVKERRVKERRVKERRIKEEKGGEEEKR